MLKNFFFAQNVYAIGFIVFSYCPIETEVLDDSSITSPQLLYFDSALVSILLLNLYAVLRFLFLYYKDYGGAFIAFERVLKILLYHCKELLIFCATS